MIHFLSHATFWRSTLLVLVSAVLCACAIRGPYQPSSLAIPEALANVKTKAVNDVEVSVAILTDKEAEEHFGLPLGDNDIQAIWMRVTNATPSHLWFIPNVLDPDIYSPDEVTLVTSGAIREEDRDRARQGIRDASMRLSLGSDSVHEGFVFVPRANGGRYVDVRLVQDLAELQRQKTAAINDDGTPPVADQFEFRFGFAIPLPDGIFDYEKLDPEKTYVGKALPDLSREELRERITTLPCCASNKEGTGDGDPVNVVIIAKAGDVLNSLSRAGWSFTHRITLKSVLHLAGATLQGNSYPVAPVSDLFLFGRKQDFALQRARNNIAQRNHMRLWLAPFTHHNTPVWVGQISRDIGIKITSESASFTTHIIDPEVDLAREYLLHSLLADGLVQGFGFAAGSRAASKEQPALNLAKDPYFSDGLRLVLILSADPVPYTEIESLLWDEVVAPMADWQSKAPLMPQKVHSVQ
ncbi:LssY C-terminal domain-containing protein [Congregibacter litoralis]|uniref:LssY-like C-terminal domain-containing protein n=1 Tax=Congregibacter litoralis KT71 TaxID=314285 RepID=A4A6I7_9GAMM|nr:LssY C-terminal domain-containing protein [Congregibacter litoralis]EAQ98634.1 hypothetical protein KT71_01615 [Congregibacter litoralis KT71]